MQYQTDDGVIHESESAARAHYDNRAWTGALVAAAMWLFIFGPIIAAKVVSWVFGALNKLGTPGRVISSVLVGLPLGIMLVAIIFGAVDAILPDFITNFVLFKIFMWLPLIAIMGFATRWYFRYYYAVLIQIPISEFSNLVKTAACIAWFGSIGGMIIAAVGNEKTGQIIMLLSCLAAVGYYVYTTLPYMKNVKEAQAEVGEEKVAEWIAVGIVVAIMVFMGISQAISSAAYKAREEKIAAIFENPKGSLAWVVIDNLNLRAKPSGLSETVKTLAKNDTLNITGNMSGVWLPVEHAGVSGWVYGSFVWLVHENAYRSFAVEPSSYEAVLVRELTVVRDEENDRSTRVSLDSGAAVKVLSISSSTYSGSQSFSYIEHDGRRYQLMERTDAEYLEPVGAVGKKDKKEKK